MRNYGPIWIDPNFYQWKYRPQPVRAPWVWTETTNVTRPYNQPAPPPVDEDRIRRIVREEIGDLPIPFDVPDTPPEKSA